MTNIKSTLYLAMLTLCALGILVALGVWQLHRLAWKTDLISRLEHGIAAPPAAYAPPMHGHEASGEFMHVKLTGRFHPESSVKRFSPIPEGIRAGAADGYGYLLFTPFEFDGGAIFVDRGFIPASRADAVISADKSSEATVTGLIRASEPTSWLTPDADFAKRLFFAADIPAMAKAAGLDKAGTVASEYIQADPNPNPNGWPRARDPRALLASIPNRHLEYALTWFGLAAALLGVFGFYIAKQRSALKVC